MGNVPTGKLERELRKYYLRWSSGMPDHLDNVDEYLDEFRKTTEGIIRHLGGRTAALGSSLGFPAPKELELSPKFGHVYADMQKAAIKASIAVGLNARDAAKAMFNSGIETEYYKLERLARTETVSAYWANQWKDVEDVQDLVYMVWSSEDSARTCDYCKSKDGMEVKDRYVRDHPNGRCTLIPMFRPKISEYQEPDPVKPSPYPSTEEFAEMDSFGKWWMGRYGGSGAYIWNPILRKGDTNAPWEDDRVIEVLNKKLNAKVKNTVGSLVQTLASRSATRTSRRLQVWRGELEHDIWETSPSVGNTKTLLATTSTSTNFGEAVARNGANNEGIIYMLDMPEGNLVLPGQRAEEELVLLPGSRIQVVKDSIDTIENPETGESIETRVVRGIVLPPVVGEPYYGAGTYRLN